MRMSFYQILYICAILSTHSTYISTILKRKQDCVLFILRISAILKNKSQKKSRIRYNPDAAFAFLWRSGKGQFVVLVTSIIVQMVVMTARAVVAMGR